jgi:hypothetical protein
VALKALCDTARVVRKVPSPERVEGTRVYVDQVGPEFRCRLSVPKSTDSLPTGNHAKTVKTASMLYNPRAKDGSLVSLRASDDLRIDAGALGVFTWQVQGTPEAMRRKSGSVVGFEVQLRLVQEPGGLRGDSSGHGTAG